MSYPTFCKNTWPLPAEVEGNAAHDSWLGCAKTTEKEVATCLFCAIKRREYATYPEHVEQVEKGAIYTIMYDKLNTRAPRAEAGEKAFLANCYDSLSEL